MRERVKLVVGIRALMWMLRLSLDLEDEGYLLEWWGWVVGLCWKLIVFEEGLMFQGQVKDQTYPALTFAGGNLRVMALQQGWHDPAAVVVGFPVWNCCPDIGYPLHSLLVVSLRVLIQVLR